MTDPRLARPAWRGRTNVDALTIAALEAAERAAGHEFVVTQGSYQGGAGDPKSAGTHDGGGVLDLRWCGHEACLRHLAEAGFVPFLRTPPAFDYHVHAVVVGHPALHPTAAAQVAERRRGGDGLIGSAPYSHPGLPVVEPVWPPKPPKPVRNTVQKARTAINRALRDLKGVDRSRSAVWRMRREVRAALRKGPKK